MKHVMTMFILFGCCQNLAAQGIFISKGVRLEVTQPESIDNKASGAHILFNGDVNNLGVIENKGEIRYNGDLYNGGQYHSSGDDLFVSDHQQSLSGALSGKNYFYNLVTDKKNSSLLFQCNTDVQHAITIGSALLDVQKNTLYLKNTDPQSLTSNARSGDRMNYIQGHYNQDVNAASEYRLINGDKEHGAQLATVNTGMLTANSVLSSDYSSASATRETDLKGCEVIFRKQSGSWYIGVLNNANPMARLNCRLYPAGLNEIRNQVSGIEAIKNERSILTDPCTSLSGNYGVNTSTVISAYSIITGEKEPVKENSVAKQSIIKKDKTGSRRESLFKMYPILFAQVFIKPLLFIYRGAFR